MSSSVEQLRHAAITGNLEQVQSLLKTGATIDPDLEGRTALHLASANGHVAIVKSLIEAGANVNALDTAGYTALHQAATEGHEEVVKLLLKNGCHVDTQDELHGNTVLHESAWKGYSRTLEILCRKGANVYIKNNGGFTPLHLACQNGHNQCCRVLLYSACKPDVRNSKYGDTPLHTAARYGHAGVLRILISAFCNVNEINKNGDTAIHISAAMGRSKLTRILLEAGSDQKLKNNQGESARDIAERKGYTEIVKLMDNPPVILIHVEEQPKSPSKPSKKREKESGTSQESANKEKKDKHKKSKKNHKVHFKDKDKKGNISPYGCHMYPDVHHFPSLKLQSLPVDPLKTGEQYYADLAGNIKKGPTGIGYMCYCAPFFNHVEKKLDCNKQELLDHIDTRNDELKAKISHLEQKTHDQLFNLNQKMKESLALERSECTERIDRKLLRERQESEGKQHGYNQVLEQQMRELRALTSKLRQCDNGKKPMPNGHAVFDSSQILLRSKSEDLLSETNSNNKSTVTGTSRFTNNTGYSKNTAHGGAKPKIYSQLSNISKLKMRLLGNPEMKRESRSEGDLTSCCTEQSGASNSTSVRARPHVMDGKKMNGNLNYAYPNINANGTSWRNYGHLPGVMYADRRSPFSNNPAFYNKYRPQYGVAHNHNQKIMHQPEHMNGGVHMNGAVNVPKHIAYKSNDNLVDNNNIIPPILDNDGSSFV